MPLHLLHTTLSGFPCDAIVTASDESLLHGGSTFGMCMNAAGSSIADELRKLPKCETGAACSISFSHRRRLPCRHLIITVAPQWKDGASGETALLAACYHNSLAEAKRLKCKKIGFGLIDAEMFGFPPETAVSTALDALCDDPLTDELDVYLIRSDHAASDAERAKEQRLAEYIDRHMMRLVENKPGQLFSSLHSPRMEQLRRKNQSAKSRAFRDEIMCCEDSAVPAELAERLRNPDEGFQEMLFRKIDAAGLTDSECYKRANISKQVFSKIRSSSDYRPKKPTVLALAIALRLDLDDTRLLLDKAGYSLSNSCKFDIIVEYFIRCQNYSFFDINEALYAYDQPLIGSE